MLNKQLVSWINVTFKDSDITFQQDGTTSYTGNLFQEWCNKNMECFWTNS